VRTEFRKARHSAAASEPVGTFESEEPAASAPEGSVVRERPPELELWLLKYLLMNSGLAQFAALHLDPLWVTHDTVRQIIGLHFQSGADVAELLSQLQADDFARSLVTEAASERRPLPNPEAAMADTILRLRNARLDEAIAAATRSLADPDLDDAERVRRLAELQGLRQAKRQKLMPLEDPDGHPGT
jgi:hypothetical protein